jgi:hypothetical protein
MSANRRRNIMTKLIARVVLTVGILLLVFMIVTEGEPGALPLLLVITGALASWRTRGVRRLD